MALSDPASSESQVSVPVCSLLVLLCLHTTTGMSGWGGCLDGQDIFTTVRENSLWGEVVAELMADNTIGGVQWSLDGKDSDWFFLDERNIRLNASADKILDRETQGPVLMAELTCYEDDTFQSVYRVVVEILNENDNTPAFAEDTVRSFFVSELTPVDSVVFTVCATDADNDKIIYYIDQTSPDADYFKVELPNSGEVILSKPLDYESKTQLTVTIHASEMSTAEHFNTSTNITITVLDGDDQYPQFLPCALLFQDHTRHICTSPMYTVNVTEGEEDVMLDFSPGPIHAVDGDRGLSSPLSYAILSGDHDGHLLMDRETGEVKLVEGVRDRLTTPALQLQVMAYQNDDPRKYSVATALVRVLAANRFYPQFERAEYHGFVTSGRNAAALVNTYGSRALMLQVQDQDFNNGFNPMIYFTFSPTSNHTDTYQVTREGFLITRNSQLRPKQKHILQVMAIDEESGDATSATVVVEVLTEGQSIPHGPLGDDRLTGCTVGKALLLSMVFMTLLACILFVMMWLKKKQKGKRDPLERGCVAQGKHPNVSLRWFQLVNQRSAMSHMEEAPYRNEEYGSCNPSFSFSERPDVYARHDLPSSEGPVARRTTAASHTSYFPSEGPRSPANNIVFTPTRSSSRSPTLDVAAMDGSSAHNTQAASALENLSSLTPPHDTKLDPTEATPNPAPQDATNPSPLTCPDSDTAPNDSPADPVTSPSSQSSIPCSRTRIASAEIDKPFRKPRVKTPPYSPLRSSFLTKPISTPPPTPEQAPLKAKLVHIDTSPLHTPPVTAAGATMTLSAEIDTPSTSLDQPDQPEDQGASQDRRASANSGATRDDSTSGDKGTEDADKISEVDDELESDEEELLRVMARCNPIFITFSK
ncbi:uncharacterized protein LOC114856732 [Betta splendens]|uniref:Uncharacterized protein LOC114856732 n=1 Tax=Betta splendens TaxID=158456 RepID=A0A6P7MND1_BETSP|nr:uncharacterized protein LOC114856732 [Betta splendens]XP_029008237.1 uncharacterized protein LOC114856732 [Betta splendens]